VLTEVTTDMVITKGATFGPVAPLYRFNIDAEVNYALADRRCCDSGPSRPGAALVQWSPQGRLIRQ
jgi:hypothetical protein